MFKLKREREKNPRIELILFKKFNIIQKHSKRNFIFIIHLYV